MERQNISGLFVCFSQISAETWFGWFAKDDVNDCLSKLTYFSHFEKKVKNKMLNKNR